MSPVEFVPVIPLLPLVALVIIFCVTRPLDVAAQRKAGLRPTGGSGGHNLAGTAAGHEQAETHGPGAAHDDSGTGGHGHGGITTTWGLAGAVIAVIAMVGAFGLSLAIFFQFLTTPLLQTNGYTAHLWDWFTFGSLRYVIDFRVDPLTAVMLVVVTGVSMLVHLYSIGYLAGDLGFSRFFMELALFTVSMLILVLGANILVLFIGWELVGLSSYLLIGFWFDQAPPPAGSDIPYPPAAALKAFVTTRFGDFGMLIGILMLFLATGTFTFSTLNNPATYQHVDQFTVTLAMILIFCGAVGKSAQFPLHVWLPDAMAGPTPVSALIHAATMVAAGVYLVARFFPLYSHVAGPQSLEVVGWVGSFTAIFAAVIALAQNDIKKVLAYSTVSQLGYMFVGLAVGPNNSLGIFHLFTHAFFKALLFLGSGSVIHAVAGNQDMRKMGGLAKYMPITAFTFLIATLSISGVPPFSGFFSKDAIIGEAFSYGTAHGGNYWFYGLTLFTAFLTAFYMFRLYFMTFGGKGGAFAGIWGGDRQYRGEAHPHESPWVMTLPLILLAFPAALLGFWSINNGFASFLTGTTEVYASPFTDPLTYVGIALAVVGIGLAWIVYGMEIIPAKAFTSNPVGRSIYILLINKFYIDEFYDWVIKYIVLGLSNGAVAFDKYVVDGIVNGSASSVRRIGDATRRTETGVLQNYGAAIFGGALIIALAVFIATGAFVR
ncbi:MAG TPA: NADH-quinone oxidoreductase subunit L [Ktedonobacterales bacterium]|jgi:proton-translocating NADH-quinone oxidoreductase chain L|nr:NADH-quinone oxidoreductase subunit L [Ktedonobacterales bacterium]